MVLRRQCVIRHGAAQAVRDTRETVRGVGGSARDTVEARRDTVVEFTILASLIARLRL